MEDWDRRWAGGLGQELGWRLKDMRTRGGLEDGGLAAPGGVGKGRLGEAGAGFISRTGPWRGVYRQASTELGSRWRDLVSVWTKTWNKW